MESTDPQGANAIVTIAVAIWLLLPIALLVLWLKSRSTLKRLNRELSSAEEERTALKNKYDPITSIEAEVERLRAEAVNVDLRPNSPPAIWRVRAWIDGLLLT